MGVQPASKLYTALIRTHHITSREKLQRVRKAAMQFDVPLVMVRYGGSPGVMYGEAPTLEPLSSWVGAVKNLRYKDFQCVCKPDQKDVHHVAAPEGPFHETESMAEFGHTMKQKGLADWFRIGLLSKRAGQFDGDP